MLRIRKKRRRKKVRARVRFHMVCDFIEGIYSSLDLHDITTSSLSLSHAFDLFPPSYWVAAETNVCRKEHIWSWACVQFSARPPATPTDPVPPAALSCWAEEGQCGTQLTAVLGWIECINFTCKCVYVRECVYLWSPVGGARSEGQGRSAHRYRWSEVWGGELHGTAAPQEPYLTAGHKRRRGHIRIFVNKTSQH